jgi:hypothetical protein
VPYPEVRGKYDSRFPSGMTTRKAKAGAKRKAIAKYKNTKIQKCKMQNTGVLRCAQNDRRLNDEKCRG